MDFITEVESQIKKITRAIPFAETRAEAEEMQSEIKDLEEQLNVCPSCGNYEIDEDDDLACGDNYHTDGE